MLRTCGTAARTFSARRFLGELRANPTGEPTAVTALKQKWTKRAQNRVSLPLIWGGVQANYVFLHAALEAASVGQEVHIIFREAHWPVPRNLAGILPFKWGMLSRLTGALSPPYLRPTPVVRWLNGIGKPLVWIFWRLVELLLYVQCRLGTKIAKGKNLVPSTPVDIDCFGEATMVPRPELYKSIRQGLIAAHRTEIAAFTRDGITLRDGDTLRVDCVVLCTGWKNDYSFLSNEAQETLGTDEDGFYLYRQNTASRLAQPGFHRSHFNLYQYSHLLFTGALVGRADRGAICPSLAGSHVGRDRAIEGLETRLDAIQCRPRGPPPLAYAVLPR